jgi:hypothetical protein
VCCHHARELSRVFSLPIGNLGKNIELIGFIGLNSTGGWFHGICWRRFPNGSLLRSTFPDATYISLLESPESSRGGIPLIFIKNEWL